jgi:hypothetical protein
MEMMINNFNYKNEDDVSISLEFSNQGMILS